MSEIKNSVEDIDAGNDFRNLFDLSDARSAILWSHNIADRLVKQSEESDIYEAESVSNMLKKKAKEYKHAMSIEGLMDETDGVVEPELVETKNPLKIDNIYDALYGQFKEDLNEEIDRVDLLEYFTLNIMGLPQEALDDFEEYASKLEDDKKEQILTPYTEFMIKLVRYLDAYYGVKFDLDKVTYSQIHTVYKLLLVDYGQLLLDFMLYCNLFTDKHTLKKAFISEEINKVISTEDLFSMENVTNYIEKASDIKKQSEENENLLTLSGSHQTKFEVYLKYLLSQEELMIADDFFTNLLRINPRMDYNEINDMINQDYTLYIEDLSILFTKFKRRLESNNYNVMYNKLTEIFGKKIEEAEREEKEIIDSINNN